MEQKTILITGASRGTVTETLLYDLHRADITHF